MNSKLRAFLEGVGILSTLLALILAPAILGAQDEPVLRWFTYAGSSIDEQGFGIAMDPSGNIYFTGWSDGTWGSPINPHSGGRDAFVAKLNSTGELLWNTFLGSSDTDEGNAIAVDGNGNVYAMGTSSASWGQPLNSYGGQGDAFVAKLNSSGNLLWNLFIGGVWGEHGDDIAVDASGNVYATGVCVNSWSDGFWGTPINLPGCCQNVFVVKLNSIGTVQWYTFIGEDGEEGGTGIAVDASEHVYVSGRSSANWGMPVNEHTGNEYEDGFVMKLDSTGGQEWHTFFGGAGQDEACAIVVDASGNIFISGHSAANWGTPINPHSGGDWNAFVVKLDSSGVRRWHTFMGESMGWDIAVDGGQNVYLTGVWAEEPLSHPGGFVAALNRDGVLQWNTFLEDCLESIALDRSRNVYVAGRGGSSLGTPVNPWAGGWDALVAKISTQQTYAFSGFDRPVDNPPIVNNAKAGSAIPVKWRITDPDGIPISDPASFISLTSYAVSCGALTADPIDEVEEYSAGASGLQYFDDGYWQFNWKTPKGYSGQCRIMVLKLGDGSEHTASFKFK